MEMATDYPWSGEVGLRVTGAPPRPCGLAVRVPAWSPRPHIRLNEDLIEAAPEGGYLVVRRRWRPGDVLRVGLDTAARLTYPDRRIDAVRGTAAIERGPLVYCLEQADQPAGVDLADLALIPGALGEEAATLPGLGDTVLVRASAVHRAPPDRRRPALPRPGRGAWILARTPAVSRSPPPLSPTSSGTTATAAPCRSGRRWPDRSPGPGPSHPGP